MKRTLIFASIIGLFMVTTMDLQAHHRRNIPPRHSRNGIGISLHMNIPIFSHRNRYTQYNHHQARHIGKEIRKNEKRIRKLAKRIGRLYRHEGNYREIRELEQEINWLERRNDYLRNQLY